VIGTHLKLFFRLVSFWKLLHWGLFLLLGLGHGLVLLRAYMMRMHK
jgi:hypothetical protein